MSIKNLDVLEQEKLVALDKMQVAMKQDDAEAFAAAFNEFAENIGERVMAKYEAQQQNRDVNVLASRGVRQLTNEENTYFQKLGEAMKTSNPKQALADLELVMPKTEIDAVFEDLTADHPLLNAIDLQNTSGLVEIIVNTNADQLGAWGALTAEIVKELAGGFKKINLTLQKYSSFILISKAMLDLGPIWLEMYVRTMLAEVIACGLEEAIIKGTGNAMPIGMNRQVGKDVTVTGGVYPEKTPVKLDSLDPIAYGGILSSLAQNENGRQRVVQNLILVVSPKDYFGKIMPATTIRAADGTYVNNVLPFPTNVIQSIHVPENQAIIGLGKKYFLGAGLGKSGKIEYSDEYHFLEDERTYICKIYANGMPKDNNAFVVCDISGLQPAVQKVEVISTGGSAGTGSESEESGSAGTDSESGNADTMNLKAAKK